MKKIFQVMMLAALTLMGGACSSYDDDDSSGGNDTPTPEAETPEYLKEGTDTRPDWTAPDYQQYEFTMALQVELGDTLAYFQSDNDLVCAKIGDAVRAVTGPRKTIGRIYYPLSIASNSDQEAVSLCYYCDRLHRIYTISNWASFMASVPPSGDDGIYRPKFTNQ